MIKLDTIRGIDDKSDEGKLLIAAVAILTSIKKEDVISNEWGGLVSPDEGIRKIQDLANRIYYKQEWEAEKMSKERDNKIEEILNDKS
jgi:hypothetical protein